MFFSEKLGPLPNAKGVAPKGAQPPSKQTVQQAKQALQQPMQKAAPPKPTPAPEPEKKKKKGWF
ncbi:hypothetical protein [Terricaulis sp.]|uniref:hypothetical protein n=1 Tax=Terricaulis sp. TaxID=2768686 RepID=UPI00378350A3